MKQGQKTPESSPKTVHENGNTDFPLRDSHGGKLRCCVCSRPLDSPCLSCRNKHVSEPEESTQEELCLEGACGCFTHTHCRDEVALDINMIYRKDQNIPCTRCGKPWKIVSKKSIRVDTWRKRSCWPENFCIVKNTFFQIHFSQIHPKVTCLYLFCAS